MGGLKQDGYGRQRCRSRVAMQNPQTCWSLRASSSLLRCPRAWKCSCTLHYTSKQGNTDFQLIEVQGSRNISIPLFLSLQWLQPERYVMSLPHEHQQDWTFQETLEWPFPSKTMLLLGFCAANQNSQPEATKYDSLLDLIGFKPIVTRASALTN